MPHPVVAGVVGFLAGAAWLAGAPPTDSKALQAELARVARIEQDSLERAPVRGWGDQETLRPLFDLQHALRHAERGSQAEKTLLGSLSGRFTSAQNGFLKTLHLSPAGQILFRPGGGAKVVTPYKHGRMEVFADLHVPAALVIGVLSPGRGGRLVCRPVDADGVRIAGHELDLSSVFFHNVVLPLTVSGSPGRRRVMLRLQLGKTSVSVPVVVDVRASGTLTGAMVDPGGRKLWAKILIEDTDGRLYVVPGERNYRTQSWYAPWQPRFSIVGETFSLPLPAGSYRVTAMKGYGWRDWVGSVKVEADRASDCRIEMQPLRDIEAEGWLCGDMHLHYPGGPTLGQLRAEDVHVAANTLYSSRKAIPLPAYEAQSDAMHLSTSNQEIEHWIFGNVFYFNIPRTVMDPPGPRREQTPMFHYDEQAHAMGGITLRWLRARPFSATWHGQAQPELAVSAALGHMDVWSVLDNSMQSLLDSAAHPWTGDGWGGRLYAHTYRTWYALANCGLRIAAGAGTSYGRLSRIGFNRVYAKVSGKLTNASWAEALKRGDGFVTNGPLLWLRGNGHLPARGVALPGPGKVTLSVEVLARHPVRRVEIVRNGEVLAHKDVPDATRGLRWDLTADVAGPAWFAARCFGEHRPRYAHMGARNQFAHTNLLFVTVGGKRPRSAADAKRFVREIDALIQYAPNLPTQALRTRALAAYGKARKYYAQQLSQETLENRKDVP